MFRTLFLSLGIALFAEPSLAVPSCSAAQLYEGAPLRLQPSPDHVPSPQPGTKSFPSRTVAKLGNVLSEFRTATKPPAVGVALIRETGETWTSTVVDTANAPDRLFYWASVGKAWTAVVTLQLVDEGKLMLTDRLDAWVPDYPNANLITVAQLLTHTSGAFSFQNDVAFRSQPGFKTADEQLRVAKSHAAEFCPGRTWAYSNTGYVLLGRIIETIEGRPLHQSMTVRIVDRLGLRETRILAPGMDLDGIQPLQPTATTADGANDDMRTPGAAGPVAASAADMARFWYATLAGELTSSQISLERFVRLFPMSGQPGLAYGRGVMVYDVPASPNTPADIWLGHSGGLPGAKAVVAWSINHRAVVAVAVTGDGPAEALANRMLAALD